MKNLINIDDYKPHIIIDDSKNKKVHVIPLSVFQDIISGKLKLCELECFEEIVPIILSQWIVNL